MCTARDELYKLLRNPEVAKAPVLIFANKQDLKEAIEPAELTQILHLYALNNREWNLV